MVANPGVPVPKCDFAPGFFESCKDYSMIESEAEDKNESQLVGAVQVTGWCISQPFEHEDQESYISREFGDSF